MRFFEIDAGIRVWVSEEEQHILNLLAEHKALAKRKLDERQQEVCRLLVSRGVLNRVQQHGEIYYEANGLPDLWRGRT